MPRPSKVGTRFEFCALDTLFSKSRSFLRRACYPHHILTDTLPRYPLFTHKISAPWDGAFDVPRPSKVGTRFEFCALDTLFSKSRSFLRRACYPHHILTDTPPRYPLFTHKISAPWDGAFDVPRPSKVGTRFEFCALDTLFSKSRSFLRRACYPHHILTDTLENCFISTWDEVFPVFKQKTQTERRCLHARALSSQWLYASVGVIVELYESTLDVQHHWLVERDNAFIYNLKERPLVLSISASIYSIFSLFAFIRSMYSLRYTCIYLFYNWFLFSNYKNCRFVCLWIGMSVCLACWLSGWLFVSDSHVVKTFLFMKIMYA